MAKEGLIIKELDKKTDSNVRAHWVNGMPFTCPGGVDCQLCQEEKRRTVRNFLRHIPYPRIQFSELRKQGIPRWVIGRTIEGICRRCKHEKVPCYQCIRRECEQWGKDPATRGTDRACPHFFDGFCQMWRCTRKNPLVGEMWERV